MISQDAKNTLSLTLGEMYVLWSQEICLLGAGCTAGRKAKEHITR